MMILNHTLRIENTSLNVRLTKGSRYKVYAELLDLETRKKGIKKRI